ncbi:hypothetical protein GCM10008023_29130 [Sphingomonas glacialis]|uniref:Uncharacterized protein n=1 Tax=Sphingomonas glacialis TaxID=658225 RepID=A0ABQ3LMH4_9SPHN|nr:hypothetical protein GCM10008023_29130 [Sphingomonas glacialis]
MFAIGIEAGDLGIVFGGKTVDEPRPNGIDSLDFTEIDARHRAVESAQALGQVTDIRQGKATGEANDVGIVGEGGHFGHLTPSLLQSGWIGKAPAAYGA